MIFGAGFRVVLPGAAGDVKCGCVNTALASRKGLSKPTVQTKNGRASVRATGSMGILSAMAMGNASKNERIPLERMARGSQKLLPSLRLLTSSRRKVVCMRM